MQTYSDFAPTGFDARGAFLTDRQDWLVLPVGETRDSGCLDKSNFAAATKSLEEADPEGETWEEHSFNHWGPGWFSILIVKPGSKAADVGTEIEAALADYPVLDEEDHSRRESEDLLETLTNCYSVPESLADDVARVLFDVSSVSRSDELTEERVRYAWEEASGLGDDLAEAREEAEQWQKDHDEMVRRLERMQAELEHGQRTGDLAAAVESALNPLRCNVT